MGRRVIFTSFSPEETLAFGKRVGEHAPLGTVFSFFGDLGSGKTTFIKGILSGVGIDPEEITSPTFTYMHSFTSKKNPAISIYHFDLYRLKTTEDFITLGFHEYLQEEGAICCIEWSDKIASLLPKNTISLTLSYQNTTQRIIEGNIPWLS